MKTMKKASWMIWTVNRERKSALFVTETRLATIDPPGSECKPLLARRLTSGRRDAESFMDTSSL